jgi:hypothetical protein
MPDNAQNLVEKLPPQNIEAEQSLLGALLIDKDAIIKIADLLKAGDFYSENHNIIFETILDLFERKEEIDLLSLSSRLQEKNLLEKESQIYEIQSIQKKDEEEKKKQAELIQKYHKVKDKNKSLQKELDHYKKLLDIKEISQAQKKIPSRKSTKDASQKINWPSQAHHYPKRFAAFLEKMSKSQYVDEIHILSFENSPHSRIKSVDSQGNIFMLYSDGEKAAKILVQTTGDNLEEGLFIEEEILDMDHSILSRN